MPRTVPAEDWTPERIADLRSALGMTQADFGQEIYDASPSTAQNQVSRLESGDVQPGSAARRTLTRLAEKANQNTA